MGVSLSSAVTDNFRPFSLSGLVEHPHDVIYQAAQINLVELQLHPFLLELREKQKIVYDVDEPIRIPFDDLEIMPGVRICVLFEGLGKAFNGGKGAFAIRATR